MPSVKYQPSPQTPLPRGEGLCGNVLSPKYIHDLAAGMRRRETAPERILWQALRHRGLAGLKFRRQHPFGRYILDFYCRSIRLAVELDGMHHFSPEQRMYDALRTLYLESSGIRVIRFANARVLMDLPGVLQNILMATPLPRGEGQG